jgi:protein TonB
MSAFYSTEAYTPREIAQAVGVSVDQVRAALRGSPHAAGFVPHAEAVRLGRALRIREAERVAALTSSGVTGAPNALFSIFDARPASRRNTGLPLAVSSTIHAGIVAFLVVITTFGLAPTATPLTDTGRRDVHMVFVATPGPGGGGGGGGLRQPLPSPKAQREGRRALSSPVPPRRPEPEIKPAAASEPPLPRLESETLPTVVAPIVAVHADHRDRVGALREPIIEVDSRGPGRQDGVGTGAGTGLGEGDGSGVGEGWGGGTGGGPYRPGSGIEPPRLLREVKADYTDEARRRGVRGEVLLEVVVRRDGTVGDVNVIRRLDPGLDDRAARAVRQWRFAPATRRGVAVDVVVEVAVEFSLR